MKGEGYYRYEGMRYLTAGVIVSDSAFLTMILYTGFYCSTNNHYGKPYCILTALELFKYITEFFPEFIQAFL